MADLDLFGPLLFTNWNVNANVAPSPGVYVYGNYRRGIFSILYVGRSDVNLRDRLLDYIGTTYHFKWKNHEQIKDVFDGECVLYHEFNPEKNSIHPDRPPGKIWKCPVCEIFND